MQMLRELGSTGITIHRVGISTSFGGEKDVYQTAFDYGCNYFTWGTFIKGRNSGFLRFVHDIGQANMRDRLVIGLLSYSHSGFLGEYFLGSALKQLKTDYVDSLILGYFSKPPSSKLLNWVKREKERGRIRSVGLTTHNRSMVPLLAEEGNIDYFHVRYNAAHRGAEKDVFPHIDSKRTGLVSFTATCWGKLMNKKKLPHMEKVPTAGDCYRFVLSHEAVDCCMMGVKNKEMLKENLSAIDKGIMSEEELTYMRQAGDYLYGGGK